MQMLLVSVSSRFLPFLENHIQSYISACIKSKCMQVLMHTSSKSSSRLPVLTLYTKYPCPLCDDAKEKLQPYSHLFTMEEVDITSPENKEWFKKYRYDIPVFHFEGEFLMQHKADVDALKTALQKYQNK